HVSGVKLVPAQRHQVLLSFELLLGQRQSHLLGADRIDAVIEFEHFALPDVLISLTAVITAAPPSSDMNSRRLIVAPKVKNHAPHRLTAVRVLERGERGANCDQLFWVGYVGFESHDRGQNRKSSKSANVFRFAPESGLKSDIALCRLSANSRH